MTPDPREFVTKLEVFRTKSRANSPLHQSTLMDLNVAPKTQLEMEKVRAPTVQKTSELVSLSGFSLRVLLHFRNLCEFGLFEF